MATLKYLFHIFLFLLACQAFAAWHDEDAKCCLELKSDTANTMLFLELKGLQFPSSLENGMIVYDDGGRKLPYRFEKKSQTL